jgi:tRNA(Ile)-lysidine synthase
MSPKNLSAGKKILKFFDLKLKDEKIKSIYQKFEKKVKLSEAFAIAVSGGPDSLALSFLAKLYSIKNNINVSFYIVNHKLRSNSYEEANYVNILLKRIFVKAKILEWHGIKPSKNLQAIARNNRYNLIFKECRKKGIKNILLGHHQDDVLENFIIRLVRGSGLRGLVSLDEKNFNTKFNILRPLIDLSKKDLIYVSKKIFNEYVQDPSNNDEIFKRVKVRNLIKNLEREGLDKKKFVLTIDNLKKSNNAIKNYVKENIQNHCFFSKKKNILIIDLAFFEAPDEIVFRSFSECLQKIGGNYYFVRGKKLSKIIEKIIRNKKFKGTLGGCIIKKFNQTLIISRESQ